MTKRFIAGAVCPNCQALDRIYIVQETTEPDAEPVTRRVCAACGFTDLAPEVRHTSVPRGKPERAKVEIVEASPIKILPSGED